jgi:hypothetical protein
MIDTTTAKRLQATQDALLKRRADLEAEHVKVKTTRDRLHLERTRQAEADRKALADAIAADLKDGGTREATVKTEHAARDRQRADDDIMRDKAMRRADEEVQRLEAELSDLETRLGAAERAMDEELTTIAQAKAADILTRYRAALLALVDMGIDLAAWRAMAATREADRVPWLAMELPLFGIEHEGFTAPAGFKIEAGQLTADARPILNVTMDRFTALLDGILKDERP